VELRRLNEVTICAHAFALLVRGAPIGRISGDETKEKRLVRWAHRETSRMEVLFLVSESL
jgi:hypothetical protein